MIMTMGLEYVKSCTMKAIVWLSLTRAIGALIGALVLICLSGCQDQTPTHNLVRSIDLDEFDQRIRAQTFNGLVAVIASWCPPCREELPILGKLDRQYRNQGIQIVAVSIDKDSAKAIQPLVNASKIDFPIYWIGSRGVMFYKIRGVPTLLVIRNGQLVKKLPGSLSRKRIEKLIKSLIEPANER